MNVILSLIWRRGRIEECDFELGRPRCFVTPKMASSDYDLDFAFSRILLRQIVLATKMLIAQSTCYKSTRSIVAFQRTDGLLF